MARSIPTQPAAEEAALNGLSDSGPTQQQTSPNTMPDHQDDECSPCISTGLEAMIRQSEVPDGMSIHTKNGSDSPAAAEQIHRDIAPEVQADSQEKTRTEHVSGPGMKTYAMSRVYATSPCTCEQSQAHGRNEQHGSCLGRPRLRRRHSSPGSQQLSSHSSPLRCRPRQLSIPDSESQYAASENGTLALTFTVAEHQHHVAVAERWSEEFHETRAAGWQSTAAALGEAWRHWCFAQRKVMRIWLDNYVREDLPKLWQPMDDFSYVLSVYSFLEGVRDRNLQPQLRTQYMGWRSPEQLKLHGDLGLTDEEEGPSEDTLGDGSSQGDDDLTATASKYPLTLHQHLNVGRVCSDAERILRNVHYWFVEFQKRRVIFAGAIREFGLPREIKAECRSSLEEAGRECSSLARALVAELKSCRIRLCEALGLDPDKVPGGDATAKPSMTVMKYDKTPDIPVPSQGSSELPRHFRLKKAALQASRVALKANLFISLLPCKIAKKSLERMLVKSTKMADDAREAGDYKAETAVRSLHNKIRKVSERASQESPDVKPRMTLLDSATWPSVLSPRKDMEVKVHGPHRSLPVETFIDMLKATPKSASEGSLCVQGSLDGPSNHAPAASTTTTPQGSPIEREGEDHQPPSNVGLDNGRG